MAGRVYVNHAKRVAQAYEELGLGAFPAARAAGPSFLTRPKVEDRYSSNVLNTKLTFKTN